MTFGRLNYVGVAIPSTAYLVVASAAKQSRVSRGALDCFAALATTVKGGVATTEGGRGVKRPAVYIMANKRNGTLYTGVTSNLGQRVWQHREGMADGFTKRYGCKLLVWFEVADTMEVAIGREKQIKGGSRAKKLALIEGMNPPWNDLYAQTAHG